MHLRLSPKIEEKLSAWRLKYLPRTLFFRTMLLIFVPLVAVQIVSVVVFFDGSWSRMGRRLSVALASDMSMIVNLVQDNLLSLERAQQYAKDFLGLDVEYIDLDKHSEFAEVNKSTPIILGFLDDALREKFSSDGYKMFLTSDDNNIVVVIDKGSVGYKFVTPKKRIFSSSIFMFVVWMVVTSLLLFFVAVLFLRIQVRAISDLARVAEDFGKGIDDKTFKPYGSSEVRKAALAFIKMKERILRQISERTQMLAGVSHDLRTPLTRMKLQAAMLLNSQDRADFEADINEMEKMLNGYLAFVRGEGEEETTTVDLKFLLDNIVERQRFIKNNIIYNSLDCELIVKAREQSLRRAVTNLVSNAARYGDNVKVEAVVADRKVYITIEDDGPGIPKDKRDDVFKAFYRMEESRNKETGGVGLGLPIAKDVVTSHGGTIELFDSDMGGLKVIVKLPL
ncbi:MAG: two-component sensor histidine kinase [Alphaproteobacteria bacterium]|nr:two-component sensor histidine kinase [Alphaproteobacteria bacterium]